MRTILTLAVLLLVSGIAVAADVKTRDIVYYDARTKKDETLKDATITDQNAGGLVVKPRTGAPRTIPAEDIRFIDFDQDAIDAIGWRRPYGEEVGGQKATKDTEKIARYQEALKAIGEMEPKAGKLPEVLRYLHYKQASIKAQMARVDSAHLDAAIAALTKFKADHNDGWTIGLALRTLAELQREKGDLKAVEATYQELSGVKGAPQEIRWECEMQVAAIMMETDRAAGAEAKLKSLVGSLPQDHPFRERATVGLLRCQIAGGNPGQAEKDLRATLAKAADPAVKGMVHNTLGDYYLKTNKPEEAFWEYLKVDTLYADDKAEHARALYHLSNLFRTVKKNTERADACKDTLLKDKRFDGSEYQKRARDGK